MFIGTTTFAGTGNAVVLLLESPTVSPPAGAIPVSVTVPVVVWLEMTFTGLNVRLATTAGMTVSGAVREAPLGKVAVMPTIVLAATASDVALNVPLLALPAMLKLAGTVAAPVLLLIKVTVKPDGGAGPVNTSVPTETAPPVTVPGLKLNDMMAAGFTVRVPLMLLAPSVPVTITFFTVATPTVVAEKLCDAVPEEITMLAGTVTDGSELLMAMVTPPAGAAWLRVTVTVELVPPCTVVGFNVTPVTVTEGATVTVPGTLIEPVEAVTVTGVELPTGPAVTMNV